MNATVKRYTFLLIGFSLLSFGVAQTKFAMSATLEPSYIQGSDGEVAISVQLDDDSASFDEAVVFLNVVEVDDAGRYPQAAHKIFRVASETPEVFKQVYSREALEAGISTTLTFGLNNNAKPATYALVLQVFEGSNTNPNAVNVDNRIALQSFNFDITE